MEDESAIWPATRSIDKIESEGWYRVNWRLLEEKFLGWFIWLKDNSVMVEAFVEEVKSSITVKDLMNKKEI